MKNLLKSTNLMWAAIAVLAVIQFCPALGVGSNHSDKDGRSRMGQQMRERMGSRWDGMKEKRQAPQRQGRHKKEEK
jgi:hypothetical protein